MSRSKRSFGQISKLPSGRYRARYSDPLRRRVSPATESARVSPHPLRHNAPWTFETRGDAEAWLVDERRLITSGAWSPPSQRIAEAAIPGPAALTLEMFAEEWLTGRTLKPRTRAHYRHLLERQIYPRLGALELAALTPSVVRGWHAAVAPGTPTLLAHSYALLRTILGAAVAEQLIPVSPCTIRGAGNQRRARKVEPASLAELERLVASMPERYRLMVLLASWCALRFGELTELRRRDVDTKAGLLRIRRAVVRVDHQTLVGTPKSAAGSRDVAIPPHLVPVVREHLLQHTEAGADGLLFPARGGGHMAPSTLYRVFYKAREDAGRPDLRFHDLRHTGAVLAAQTGATLAELMSRLGHSTPAAAMRYQHAAQGRDLEIAKALSRMAGHDA